MVWSNYHNSFYQIEDSHDLNDGFGCYLLYLQWIILHESTEITMESSRQCTEYTFVCTEGCNAPSAPKPEISKTWHVTYQMKEQGDVYLLN